MSVLASQKNVTTVIQMKDGKIWHHLGNEVVLFRKQLVRGLRTSAEERNEADIVSGLK